MSVYVDDLTLALVKSKRGEFWRALSEHVNLGPPTEFGRVLGRNHRLVWMDGKEALALESSDFAKQCVQLYSDLANKPIKSYASPCWDEGSLIASDDESRGQLAPHAAKLVMKLMWLRRVPRPDVMLIINPLAKHITTWSVNDDRRTARLIGYLQLTHEYAPVVSIQDPPDTISISLFCDADFAGDVHIMKSTSGYVLALTGPSSFALLSWGSKRQCCVTVHDRK